MINGVLCHEVGRPSAWKYTKPECGLFGCTFTPGHRWQKVCESCADINF